MRGINFERKDREERKLKGSIRGRKKEGGGGAGGGREVKSQ